MARVIDSDAHVVEGREFMAQMLERFPDKIRFAQGEEATALYIEGRPYPQSWGPGAGCRAEEGMCLDRGANPVHGRGRARRRRPRGHRRHGVLPERGARPAGRTRTSASPRRWRAPTTPGWPTGAGAGRAASTASAWCRSRTSPTSIAHHAGGEGARPEGHHGPGGPEGPQPRSPRPRALLRRGRGPRHAARHPRRARDPSAQPGLASLRQLPPGALRELPLRHDGGVDGAHPGRRASNAIRGCASRCSSRASAGCRTSWSAWRSTSRSAAA